MYFIASLFLVHFAIRTSAVPISSMDISARQDDPCHNLGNTYVQSCWDTLGLSNYLTHWNETTPVCTGASDSACCQAEEPWSTCFLRLARGSADKDCSEINTGGSCSSDSGQSVDQSIAAEVHYVLKNIYAINNFFTTWYNALAFATTSAQLNIQSIVTEIDPPQKTNVLLSQILTALSVGLSFIAGPEAGPLISGVAAAAGQVFVKALQQAPSVAAAIWPSGTQDSQSIQIGNLDSELEISSTELANITNSGLEVVMSDMPSFIAFASSGAFSGPQVPSLPDQASEVTLALKTYILATAMTANKWSAQPWDGPKERAMDLWKCAFDSKNVCGDGYAYYSEAKSRAYNLVWPGKGPKPGQLMMDIVSNKWADLGLLFDGAYDCTAAGKMGQDPFANFGQGGDTSTACVSQLKSCIGCGEKCPVALIDGACPFESCRYRGQDDGCPL